ncbi:MAG: recombinase family protein [Planctomycetes bacterium]|nr:recombinase family protein [Planctomycetota bacterium]
MSQHKRIVSNNSEKVKGTGAKSNHSRVGKEPLDAKGKSNGQAQSNGKGNAHSSLHPLQFPVRPLTEATKQFPDAGLVVYSRVSSWQQAGRGKRKLQEKTDALVNAIRAQVPARIVSIVDAVEEGKLTKPRPKLQEAARLAAKQGCILVVADLSRFLRAEAYDPQKNLNAWPTREEFAHLKELTLGVPLATVASPFLSESDRHSAATRRTGKAGRPRKISPEMEADIFERLGCYAVFPWDLGGLRWERSLATVAKLFGVHPSTIKRMADRKSPSGRTWKKEGLRKAERQGLLEITEDGICGRHGMSRSDWEDPSKCPTPLSDPDWEEDWDDEDDD